jgi:hypothetical protein
MNTNLSNGQFAGAINFRCCIPRAQELVDLRTVKAPAHEVRELPDVGMGHGHVRCLSRTNAGELLIILGHCAIK